VLEYFSYSFFTLPIQLLLVLLFLAYFFIHAKLLARYWPFALYALMSFLQAVFALYIMLEHPTDRSFDRHINLSVKLFIVAEFLVVYTFIIRIVKGKLRSLVLKFLLASFSAFLVYSFVEWKATATLNWYLTVMESYLIIIACLIFFFEIFSASLQHKLTQLPDFWIAGGFFLFFSLVTTLFFNKQRIDLFSKEEFHAIYTLNFIGYIILFLSLLNALRCQVRLTKHLYS
jgi:hypothetical protein